MYGSLTNYFTKSIQMYPEIPKTIHLLCKDKKDDNSCLQRVKELHPDWTIVLYNDADMHNMVQSHFPNLSDRFFEFPLKIQQLDVFRVMIVYLFGGFYMDTDVYCKRPLTSLLSCSVVFGEEKTLRPDEMNLPHHKFSLRIANYMFGSTLEHPFLAGWIQRMLDSANLPVYSENDVLESTGPGLLTNYYHECLEPYKNEIHLIRNTSLHCPKNCSKQPSCHFGDYAVHRHQGSWRWEKNSK